MSGSEEGGSDEEMDYDQAVESLQNMFPSFSKDLIIRELTAVGKLCFIRR